MIDGDEGMVPAKSIQPIGLLTNELVTNAAKHGAGKIEVTFRVSGDVNRLMVCDEGTGLKPGFDPHSATAGLGMRSDHHLGPAAARFAFRWSAGHRTWRLLRR